MKEIKIKNCCAVCSACKVLKCNNNRSDKFEQKVGVDDCCTEFKHWTEKRS